VRNARPDGFAESFCLRTKELREARGMTALQMARRLGVSVVTYYKYEKRTPLPHHLIERFAALINVEIDVLFDVGGTKPLRFVKDHRNIES
jgi:transcriptional regulator with XRE-family HTH domain